MLKRVLIFLVLYSHYSFAITSNNAFQQIVNNEKKKLHISELSLSILLADQKTPVTIEAKPNTLFQVGSITKTFTALLVARAIENKQLNLSDTLGKFFPQYPKWKNITIEQLINQTSGIFDYIQSENWWINLSRDHKKIWQAKELIDIAYAHPNNFVTGSAWQYSNTNYIILGVILEKITGKPFAVLMKELFKEAQLNNTYYIVKPYSADIMQQMAHGFYRDMDMTSIHGSWIQSSGAIVASTSDIARWGKFFYHNDIPFDLHDTSSGKSLNTFNKSGYSFGAFRMNTPEGLIWFTPGLTSGYTSMLVYAPCLDAYFAYSANLAPLKDFHKDMLLSVLHELNHDQQYLQFLHKHVILPAYCATLKPADRFDFPKIG